MADIIDIFLVFWCVLALGVYIFGLLYEQQLEANNRKAASKKKRASRSLNDADYWSSPSSGARDARTSSHYYDHQQSPASDLGASLGGGYSSGQHYQQPSFNTTTSVASPYDEQNNYIASGPSKRQYNFNNQQQQQASHYADEFTSMASKFNPLSSASYQSNYEAQQGDSMGAISSSGVIPTATGFNGDCVEWVNSILYLFYTQPHKYGPVIAENVYRSLNEKLSNITSTSSDYANLLIEFEGIQGERCSQPELTNIRTECESDRSVSVVCKLYNKRMVLNLLIKRLLGGGSATSIADQQERRYELLLENLEGKLKSMAILGDKLLVIQFIEKPDTKILLRPIGGQQLHAANEQQQLINEDVLVQMILQTLTQVVVDLYFGNDPEFPQYKSQQQQQQQQNQRQQQQQQSAYSNYKHKINNIFKGSAGELKRSLKHDLFGSLTSTPSTSDPNNGNNNNSSRERKVFVKILRAKNINYNQNVTCLMELDAPKQQAISSTKPGNSNPFWDEHFLFTVSEKSRLLSFELWDSLNLTAVDWTTTTTTGVSGTLPRKQQAKGAKWTGTELTAGGAKFLGLARVSIDALRQEPVQRLNLTLQPASGTPNDLSNSVGGELQLELLFLEHSSSAAAAAAGASNSPPSTLARSSSGNALHKSNSLSSLGYHQGDIVSIDRKLTPSGYVITTTTITKQAAQNKQQATAQSRPEQQLLLQVRNQSPTGSSSVATEHSFDELINLEAPGSAPIESNFDSENQQRLYLDGRSEMAASVGNESPSVGGGGEGRLSRSRSRSRTFLRAIKKRFSFSRTRSKSVGGGGGGGGISSDNLRPGTSQSGHLNYNDDNGDEDRRLGRSRASSEMSTSSALDLVTGRAKSVPAASGRGAANTTSANESMAGGGGSELPTIVINKSRMSADAIALSSSGGGGVAGRAFNFEQPKSQLVIEVLEPTLRADGNGNNSGNKGIYRYYAIADDMANQRKWRKRGTKLHLFNEHLFVACHLPSSSTCHLCGKVFSRRPGKQGYKCRNCHLLLHKQCHVKVDHNCPYAARQGLQLEYIDADPPSSLIDELSTSTSQQQQMGAINVDVTRNEQNTPQSSSFDATSGSDRWDEPYLARQKTPGKRATATTGVTSPFTSSSQRATGTRPNMTRGSVAKSISMEVEEH